MISVLLITILAIGLAAAAGYGMLTLVKTSDLALTVQRNQIRVDAVAASLAARVAVGPDGKVLVPLLGPGETLAAGDAALPASGAPVPSFSPFKRTVWGAGIVYCPAAFGEVGSGAGGSTDLGDYTVRTVALDGGTFVTAGAPAFAAPPTDLADDFDTIVREDVERMGAVGFLVSPAPTRTDADAISCSDIFVSKSGEHLTALHGTVTAVSGLSAGSPLMLRQTTAVRLLPNFGPGATPARPGVIGTIGEALDWAGRFDTDRVDIELAPGTYSVSAPDLANLSSMTGRRTVRLHAPAPGDAVLDFGAIGPADSTITASGRLELSNVVLRAASSDVGIVSAPGGDVRLDGTRVGFLRVSGGEARLSGAIVAPLHSAGAKSEPVVVYGGGLTIGTGVSILAPEAAAAVAARAGDVTILGSATMLLADGGRAFVTGEGARVLPAYGSAASPPTVLVNDATVAVSSSIRFGDPAAGLSVSSNGADRRMPAKQVTTCGDGGRNCTATCEAPGEYVAWGECLSGNDAPLAAFGATEDRRGWSCRWATLSVPTTPTAMVVCQGAAWPSAAARQ